MSNGIGKNPLLDISKVYLDQVAEKKDDSYLEPDMKKRQKNNEKARKDMEKMGTSMKNPHFEEKQQGWDVVNSLADAYKGMQEEGYGAPGHNPGSGEKSVARAKALMDKKGQKGAPGLDAMMAANKEHKARRGVKKEELELDENRRAARAAGGYKDDSKKQNDPSKAGFTGIGNMSIDQIRKMSARMDKEKKESYDPMDDPDFDHDEAEKNRGVSGKNNPKGGKALSKKKKMKEGLDPVGKEDGDVNNDGKKDSSDSYLMKRRKAIGSAMKKKLKESRSLAEVMTDTEDDKPIKEKKISNKIKINPKLGEAVEELGGELLEMTEVDEAVYGGTPPEKKDTRMTVTNADKKGNTPAYQAYKAGNKKYKAADHMKEGDGDPCWDSHKQVGMKKKGGKMVPNCVPKNEEVETEVEEGYKELSRGKRNTMFRKAGNLARTALQGGDKGTEAHKKSGKIVKALNKDAEKYDRNDVKEDASMTPQELQLQKKKAMIDRMIAQRRQQGLNKAKKSEAPTKAMGEETEDSLRDRRMERGGVDGNNRYKRAPKNVAMGGGKKKPYDGMSALEKVKASIRAKHGQGAIMDTKKK